MLMDVNKLKKINQLTATLKKHGMAACTEDAVELVNRISNKEGEIQFNDLVAQSEKIPAENNEESDARMEKNNSFNDEQITHILQKFADQFSEEINSMKQRVEKQDELIKQLSIHYGSNNEIKSTEKISTEDELAVNEIIKEESGPKNQDRVISGAVIVDQASQHSVVEEKPQQNPVQEPQTHVIEQQETINIKEQPSKNGSGSPRSGGYASDDVSIEKFFYFGNK